MKYKTIKKIAIGIFGIFFASTSITQGVFAAEDAWYGINMSPLNQTIILEPGELYTGTFTINNPNAHISNFSYETTIGPFYVDENDVNIFDQPNSYNQITDWTTLDRDTGILRPGESSSISYTINVPEDAPAGGQYMAITVTSDESSEQNMEEMSAGIIAKQAMAFLVYAEIAGTTIRQGEIIDANVPSFLLDGNISGTSTIKNTGNVHSSATYKLQVFPLFSDEEIYTNEENPESRLVLPDRALMNTSYWDETPAMGIFNVKYTVEFEGVTTEVTKMVIKCPLWLLFVILFVIVAIIIWLVMKSKSRKKAAKK